MKEIRNDSQGALVGLDAVRPGDMYALGHHHKEAVLHDAGDVLDRARHIRRIVNRAERAIQHVVSAVGDEWRRAGRRACSLLQRFAILDARPTCSRRVAVCRQPKGITSTGIGPVAPIVCTILVASTTMTR